MDAEQLEQLSDEKSKKIVMRVSGVTIAGNAAITKCTSSAIGYTTVNSATAYTNNIKLLSLVFIAFLIFIFSPYISISG